jgi:hypothetical protein
MSHKSLKDYIKDDASFEIREWAEKRINSKIQDLLTDIEFSKIPVILNLSELDELEDELEGHDKNEVKYAKQYIVELINLLKVRAYMGFSKVE